MFQVHVSGVFVFLFEFHLILSLFHGHCWRHCVDGASSRLGHPVHCGRRAEFERRKPGGHLQSGSTKLAVFLLLMGYVRVVASARNLPQNDAPLAGALPEKTDQDPFVRCVANSDERDLIALSLLDARSRKNIVSLDIEKEACTTSVNVQATIECRIFGNSVEVYAAFYNFTAGETRTFTCRRTYFDDSISYKDKQLNVTVLTGVTDIVTSSSGKPETTVPSVCEECTNIALNIVIVVLTAVIIIVPAIGAFIWFRRRRQMPGRHQETDRETQTDTKGSTVGRNWFRRRRQMPGRHQETDRETQTDTESSTVGRNRNVNVKVQSIPLIPVNMLTSQAERVKHTTHQESPSASATAEPLIVDERPQAGQVRSIVETFRKLTGEPPAKVRSTESLGMLQNEPG